MKRYLIVVESSGNGYSAYAPDLEGCAASGFSKDEVEKAMLEAMKLHLAALEEDGYKTPEPRTYAKYIEISE